MEVRPGYKLTEVGLVPTHWEIKSLGEVAMIKDGTHQTPKYVASGIPFFSVEHVTSGNFRDTKFISEKEHRFLTRSSKIEKGDILMTRIGSIGDCKLIDWEVDASYYVSLALLKIRSGYSAGYIAQYSKSASFQKEIELHSLQSAIPKKINLGPISEVRVAIPPRDEQFAIAEALSEVDRLLAGLDCIIAKKRDLKQAAMQQLLTGQTRLPGFKGEWELKQLGDCLMARPDYGINAAAVQYSDRLPSYIRITDISEDGRFCPVPRVSVAAANANQYYLRDGDIVFARTGASVGKSYRYEPIDGELVFAGFLIRVRPNPEVLVSSFLAAFTTTKPYWNWVRLMSMRSGQPGINGNEYAQMPLSLPSLSEQSAIAAVFSDMDAELTILEARRDKTHALKQGMMQELLTGRTRLV